MPRPKPKLPEANRMQANRIFVDRAAPKALFMKIAGEIPEESAELLVFYGLSGQGKSALSREFKRIFAEDKVRFGHICCGLVDLQEHQLSDPALLMLWLRDALAINRDLRFPAFDLAFAMYWNAANQGHSKPAFRGGWLTDEGNEAGSEVLCHTPS